MKPNFDFTIFSDEKKKTKQILEFIGKCSMSTGAGIPRLPTPAFSMYVRPGNISHEDFGWAR